MDWLLVILGTFAAVELFLRLPFLSRARELGGVFAKTSKTIRSARISDHWKEKVLVRYAGRLLSLSLTLLALIVVILVPIALVSALGAGLGIPVLARFSTVAGTGVSILAAFGYLFLRRQVVRP